MTNPIESKYAKTLNELDVMQQSPAYAVRRQVLATAERIIIELERCCNEQAEELAKIKDFVAKRDWIEKPGSGK